MSRTMLSPRALAERWGRSTAYLADLRATGKGPPFIAISERVIRYYLDDVEAYERSRRYVSSAARSVAVGDAPEAACGAQRKGPAG